MRRKGAETVILYYKAIPGMKKLLLQEQDMLEEEYDGLRGTAYDGMPHSAQPGNPTAMLAAKVADQKVYERLQEIKIRLQVLEGDAAAIRGVLDDLNSKYKSLVFMKLLYDYSWPKISAKLSAPDSTVRYWYKLALNAAAKGLDDLAMPDELLERASRARGL